MDIKKAVEIIDTAPCFPGSKQQREAWQTVKNALAQHVANKQIMPVCFNCGRDVDPQTINCGKCVPY